MKRRQGQDLLDASPLIAVGLLLGLLVLAAESLAIAVWACLAWPVVRAAHACTWCQAFLGFVWGRVWP